MARKYTGKYPNRIKEIYGISKGIVGVTINSGDKFEIHARDTKGVMPKLNEDITKYLAYNPNADYEFKKNPRDIHIDIGAHNVKRNPKHEFVAKVVQVDTTKSVRISKDVCYCLHKTIANELCNVLNNNALKGVAFRVQYL